MNKRIVLLSLAILLIAGTASADNTVFVDPGGVGALEGNFGLSVQLDGSLNNTFVAANEPNDEVVVRATFMIDPNGLTMNQVGNRDRFDLLQFRGQRNAAQPQEVRVVWLDILKKPNDKFAIKGRAKKQGGGNTPTNAITLEDDVSTVLMEWSQGPGGGGGVVRICRLDPNPVCKEKPNNNTTGNIDQIRFGAPKDVDATTNGTFYLDTFASFRTLAP